MKISSVTKNLWFTHTNIFFTQALLSNQIAENLGASSLCCSAPSIKIRIKNREESTKKKKIFKLNILVRSNNSRNAKLTFVLPV